MFQNILRDHRTKKIIESANNEEKCELNSFNNSEICCNKKCILILSKIEKNKILNYYKSMKSHEKENEYSKSVVIPQNLIERKGTIQPRVSNFNYFSQFNAKNNNLIVRKKFVRLLS